MKIIIPMAGSGDRFVKAGYKDPKPFIEVRGKRIIEYVCDMFDKENDEFIFICNAEHLRQPYTQRILNGVVKNYKIILMSPHKLGPVWTIHTQAYPLIKDDEPVIVCYCDNPFTWDYDKFKEYVNGKDGVIVSNTGFHPHTLSKTMFAYSKTDSGNRVSEIKEKACYTSNKFNEHASCGLYYFRYGAYIKKYFGEMIDKNINYIGEFYVTLVYNLLIRDGLSVYSFLNDFVLAFGTPNEVKNFEAWMTILDGAQVTDEEELFACYDYWREYRKLCKS
jgi:NDP-sugar pyrophosphorylase family protein